MGAEKLINNTGKFLNNCVKNNGLFLFGTIAVAWFLASTAQTVGLIFNKKISKEEKKFLVPQEIFDGAFNIATYAAVTVPMIAAAGKLAGKKFTDERAVEGARTIATVAGGIIASNIITPLLRNKSSVIIKNKIEKNKPVISSPTTLYNNKTNKPLTMQNYINMTKISTGGNLKI